jgi:divalent metal cation (Fe/Co/Zn/Cd) transporter
VADPLGAAAISVWIMYSWWDVGKEHVDTLAGRSAPTDFLQRLTFIAAHCDAKILQVSGRFVDSGRARICCALFKEPP